MTDILIHEVSESDTRTSYPVTQIVWEGRTKACESVVIADSPAFGRMLFLDGELQSASADEHIYHEALVHPVMSGSGKKVLVVGGGEGATVREVLRWNPVHVDWVDIDDELVELCETHMGWAPGVRTHPDVTYYPSDIRDVIHSLDRYDVIILDLPDPDGDTGYLYSEAFWNFMRLHLTPTGRLVTHCGPVRPIGNIGEGFVRVRGNAGVPFALNGFYSQMIPSFQSEWGFWMWENSVVGDPIDPFASVREIHHLPKGLRVVDRAQLLAWATPSKLWTGACNSRSG